MGKLINKYFSISEEVFEFLYRRWFLWLSLLNLILLWILIVKFYEVKNRLYTVYIQNKEIKFILSNLQKKSFELDENSARSFFASNGYTVEYIRHTENGLELGLKNVPADLTAKVVYLIEKNGFKIQSFKASDNTGSGVYFVELVIN